MHSFKDNEGQTWNVALSTGKVKQLSEKIGLDLLNGKHHLQVLNSLTDRLMIVFLLVEEQAKDRGMDADDFELRLYGDGYANAASIAFLRELEVFSQQLGQTVQARLTASSIQAMKKAQKRLDSLLKSGKVDSLFEQASQEMEDQMVEMEEMMLGVDGNGSQN